MAGGARGGGGAALQAGQRNGPPAAAADVHCMQQPRCPNPVVQGMHACRARGQQACCSSRCLCFQTLRDEGVIL